MVNDMMDCFVGNLDAAAAAALEKEQAFHNW